MSDTWLLVAPNGEKYVVYGIIRQTCWQRIFGGCKLTDAWGINAIVPKTWLIIKQDKIAKS
ncbi:MAG: hypothetical protein WC346_05095 [Methanogenium sp.]|jgi:hypothetical protein